MEAQRLEQELALLRSAYPDLEHVRQDELDWVRISSYPLPDGWEYQGAAISAAEVAFRIPTQIGEAPYAFFVRPRLTLAGGRVPDHYTAEAATPWGQDFAQFSWAIEGSWVPKTDIRAGANILNFARSFAQRLGDIE